MTDEPRYCVVDRPGYFGGNKAKVYSSHTTLVAAVLAMRRSRYTDASGQTRQPCCVVHAAKRKGDIVWGDLFPDVLA